LEKTSEISFDLYITANSPGEIAGWVAPLVRDLRPRLRNARITLVIVPCQYASGAELSLGAGTGVNRVVRIGGIGELLRADAASGTRLRSGARRMVLHLGGDFFFSVYLSRRLSATLWAYCSKPRWGRFVDRFFVPDEKAERLFAILDFSRDRYERIGNLALDSAVLSESEEETRGVLGLAPDEPVLAFLAGSRPVEYLVGVPYFARIAALIARKFGDHRVIFPLAPTVDEDRLRAALASEGIEWRGESRVHAIRIGGDKWANAVRGRTLEVLNCARLAVTVPGTNNLQAAALLTPFIMVLPLDRADEYPLDGIAGVLPLWIPGVRTLKKKYIMRLNEKTEFISLPNRIAGRAIAPEIRGIFSEEDVAAKAISLLENPAQLQEMSRAFWELTHERGAASRFAGAIAGWAKNEGKG
jgi:lipid-A-disaccharide synthase